MLSAGDVALIVIAPAVGSFVALIGARWPDLAGAALGRSRCDACRAPLGVAELIPLLSWLRQRGRCARCGARIDPAAPIIELAALGVAVWAAAAFPPALVWPGAALGWALLAAAETDRRTRELPDTITLGLIVAGLGLMVAVMPWRLWDCVVGAAAGGASLLALRAAYRAVRGREGLGLGDVKLFAAAGAWVGWQGLPSVLLWAGVAGLGAAAATGRLRRDAEIAFGPALAAGFWVVWSFGPIAAR